MISDNAKLRANYSYRKIYDWKKLIDYKKTKLKENNLINKFFIMSNLIGISKEKIVKKDIWIKIFEKRFLLKNRSRIFNQIDIQLCKTIEFIQFFKPKLIESLYNRKYRKKIINKLFRNKT